MVLSKYLCLLSIILRSIKTSNETKVNESYGRLYFIIDNLTVNANVLNLATDVYEILYPFLQRRVLKVKHCRLMSLLSSSRVYWSKHGQIYLSPPYFHKDIDLTVYMDEESNPGPKKCENTSRQRTGLTSAQIKVTSISLT